LIEENELSISSMKKKSQNDDKCMPLHL